MKRNPAPPTGAPSRKLPQLAERRRTRRIHRMQSCGDSSFAAISSNREVSLHFYVHRIERLARGHEQSVALDAAEAKVRADFRQMDAADQIAIRGEHVYTVVVSPTPARTRPDVAI